MMRFELLRPVVASASAFRANAIRSRAFPGISARAAFPKLSVMEFFARPSDVNFASMHKNSKRQTLVQSSLLPRKAELSQLSLVARIGIFDSLQTTCAPRALASQATGRFFSAAAHAPSQNIQRDQTASAYSYQRSMPQSQPSFMEKAQGALGVGFLHPTKMASFAVSFLMNFRFYFMYMARTTFQAVRPLLAFSVFGEVMKLVLATMSSGLFSFLFSFVLAFEVFYFFLQCYISYTFLTMFFTVLF